MPVDKGSPIISNERICVAVGRALVVPIFLLCTACGSSKPPTEIDPTAALRLELNRFLRAFIPPDILVGVANTFDAKLAGPNIPQSLKTCALAAFPSAMQEALGIVAARQFHDASVLNRLNDVLESDAWQRTIHAFVEGKINQLTAADKDALRARFESAQELRKFSENMNIMRQDATSRATAHIMEKCTNEPSVEKAIG
jgi:hypothetical protein